MSRFTSSDKKKRDRRMVEAYAEDMLVADIAATYGVTTRTVWRAVQAAVCAKHVELRSPRRISKPDERKAAVAAYVAGEGSAALARRFSVSPRSIVVWVRAAHAKVRKPGRSTSGWQHGVRPTR